MIWRGSRSKGTSAVIALRFREVEIASPQSRKCPRERKALAPSVPLTLVEAREINPPEGSPDISWRLLTSQLFTDLADARRIVEFYRCRWIIEEIRHVFINSFPALAVPVASAD